jgi:hypothetical protein
LMLRTRERLPFNVRLILLLPRRFPLSSTTRSMIQ